MAVDWSQFKPLEEFKPSVDWSQFKPLGPFDDVPAPRPLVEPARAQSDVPNATRREDMFGEEPDQFVVQAEEWGPAAWVKQLFGSPVGQAIRDTPPVRAASDLGFTAAGGLASGAGSVIGGVEHQFADDRNSVFGGVSLGDDMSFEGDALSQLAGVKGPRDEIVQDPNQIPDAPLKPSRLATALKAAGKEASGKSSPEFQQQRKDSVFKGDVRDPSTYDIGDNWSPMGVAGNVVDTLGQMAAPLALSAVPGVGTPLATGAFAAQSSAGAYEDNYDYVMNMKPEALAKSERYRDLIAKGQSPAQAKMTLADIAGRDSMDIAALIGSLSGPILGGTVTRPIAEALERKFGQSFGARLLGNAAEMPLEAISESGETLAGRTMANKDTGINRDVGEGTFNDAVMGMAAASGPAVVGSIGENDGLTPEQRYTAKLKEKLEKGRAGKIVGLPDPRPEISSEDVTAKAFNTLKRLDEMANGSEDGSRPPVELTPEQENLRQFLGENIGNPEMLAAGMGHKLTQPGVVQGDVKEEGTPELITEAQARGFTPEPLMNIGERARTPESDAMDAGAAATSQIFQAAGASSTSADTLNQGVAEAKPFDPVALLKDLENDGPAAGADTVDTSVGTVDILGENVQNAQNTDIKRSVRPTAEGLEVSEDVELTEEEAASFNRQAAPKQEEAKSEDNVLAGWTAIATNKDAFNHGRSEQKAPGDIAREIEPGYTIVPSSELAEGQNVPSEKAWKITTPEGTEAELHQSKGEVWVNVAGLEEGEGGSRIYNLAANYAHNNGLKFVGDPNGISDVALKRRPEQMLSSALKFGTTQHLGPHDQQLVAHPEIGLSALNWKEGDHAHNIRELARLTSEATAKEFPEIADIRYNPETLKFERPDGTEVTNGDFKKLAVARRAGPDAGNSESGQDGTVRVSPTAGRRSLKRAVITQQLASPEGAALARLLAGDGGRGAKHTPGQSLPGLTEILYSRSEDQGAAQDQQAGPETDQQAEAKNVAAEEAAAKVLGRKEIEALKENAQLHFITVKQALALGINGLKTSKDISGVNGFYDPKTGNVYVLSDSGLNMKDLHGIVVHEIVHSNMDKLLGTDGFQSVIESLIYEALVNEDPEAMAAVKEAQTNEANKSEADRKEEALSYFAQQNPNHPIVKKMVDEGKLFLNRFGFSLKYLNANKAALRKIIALNLRHAQRADKGRVILTKEQARQILAMLNTADDLESEDGQDAKLSKTSGEDLNEGDRIRLKSGKDGVVLRVHKGGDGRYAVDTIEYRAVKNGEGFGPIRSARTETVEKIDEDSPASAGAVAEGGAPDVTPYYSKRASRDSVPWMKDPAAARKALGLDPKKNKVRNVGEALQRFAEENYGKLDLKDYSDEATKSLGKAMAAEVRHQLADVAKDTRGTGVGWYSNNYPNAVKRLASNYPELATDKAARDMFTSILAVTSNGEKVRRNLVMARQLYEVWRSGGKMSENLVGTKQAIALAENVAVIEALAEKYGYEGMHKHLLEEMAVKDINAELRREGKTPSSDYTADMVLPRAALYFGPKLGAFYANLMGSSGYLTMDLWWSRTFNRMRGNMLPEATESGINRLRELMDMKSATDEEVIDAAVPHWEAYKKREYKGGSALEKAANTVIKAARLDLNQAPEGARDRKFMYAVAKEAQRLLKASGSSLSIADIQAALWYYEKRLYSALGVRGKDDIGYEEAINESADSGNRSGGRFAPSGRRDALGPDAGRARAEDSRNPEGERGGEDGGVKLSRRFNAKPIQPDAVSADAYHYSNTPGLTAIDPRKAGSAGAGRERSRFGMGTFGKDGGTSARAAFYVREPGQPIPEAEDVVTGAGGQHLYRVQLDNLYDLRKDPLDLVNDINMDATEEAISEEGFDGFIAGEQSGIDSPVAVVFDIGNKTIPVESVKFSRRDPLKGYPESGAGPIDELVSVAEKYAAENDIDFKRQGEYVKVNKARAERIADAYENMEHAPNDPKVKAAYKDLIAQTTKQYEALVDAGYKFWFADPENDPYLGNPQNAMRDLRDTKTMAVFPTEGGFGSSEADVSGNPLLADTGLRWPSGAIDGKKAKVTANDLFRAVHDAFGHGLEGAGFRAQGEENAWQAHVRLFTGPAIGAITTETRGQNSWLNYGPHGETNRTAKVEDTIFADQKTGLMPEWAWTEGRASDGPKMSRRDPQTETPAFKKWSGGAPVFKPDDIVSDYEGGPAVFELYHGTTADFDTFSNDRASPESDMGAGFYFSNTPEDVGSNYAGLGPDLTSKIEREADRIAGETDREYNDPDVVAEARSKFMNNDGATLPVFVRTKNPAILGGEYETRLTYEESYDEETDEYGEPEGTLVDFIANLREASSNFDDGDVEEAVNSLFENGLDGDVALSDALKTLKDDMEFNSYTDDEGNMVSNEIVRQALEWSGFDSIIDFTVDEKFGSQKRVGKPMKGMTADTVHVIAFKPNQIKSSVGNSGQFSNDNPSILASRRTKADAASDNAVKREVARNTLGGPTTGGAVGWDFDTGQWVGLEGDWNRARAKLDDSMLAWRHVQDRIAESTGSLIPDAQNVYRLQNLMHGRVSEGVKQLEDKHIEPLVKAMDRAGLSVKDVESYMHARHAQERNEYIAAHRPGMPDGGSGMTTKQANEILAKLKSPEMDAIARRLDAIMRQTRQRLLDHGIITQEQFDAMNAQYSKYVPLRGKEQEENEFEAGKSPGGVGRGLDGRQAPFKKAFGRGEGNMPINILGEIFGDAQRSVIAAEKARVGRAVLRIILANPNTNLWTVEPVQTEMKADDAGQIYEAVVNDWSDPSIIGIRHKGVIYKVEIKNPPLANALMGMAPETMNGVVRSSAAVQRYLSAVLTKYNPSFMPVNLIRDLVFGSTGIFADHGVVATGRVAAGYLPAMRAGWRHARGTLTDSAIDKRFQEYVNAGGKTGFVNMQNAEQLQKKLGAWRVGGYNPKSGAKALRVTADFVGDVNDSVENALRFSAFNMLMDQGWAAEKAAEYAKNITVNFNRKGSRATLLGAFFLFYNPGVQGTKAVGRMLRKPKTWAVLGAISSIQLLAAMFAMGSEDDDGNNAWDMLPDYIKRRSLSFAWFDDEGNHQYIAIPMSYGFNVFPYLTGRAFDAFKNPSAEKNRPAAMTGDVALAMLESFSPVPVEEGPLGLLPPIMSIPTQVQVNKGEFGRAIRNENNYGKYDKPLSVQGKAKTSSVFKTGATILNRIGQGDDNTKPWPFLDYAPEDLEFMFKKLGGGAGSTAADVGGLIEKAIVFGPSELTPRDFPILKRLYSGVEEGSMQQAMYYDRRAQIEKSADIVRNTFETEGQEAAQKLLDSTPALEGAQFKKYKTTTKDHKKGQIIVIDGRPQLVAKNEESIYAQYKAASKATMDLNERINDSYTGPDRPFPQWLMPDRAAEQKRKDLMDQRMEAQKKFNATWNTRIDSFLSE